MLHTSLDKHPYKQKQNISPLPLWGDNRSCRIGVLGGSFNPAHAGHLAIAQQALIRLRLHQVWFMVSPGNPLKSNPLNTGKPDQDMASFIQRLCTAYGLNKGRRLIVTDIEARMGTRYTIDTMQCLKTRFRNAHFVWLMGADSLLTLPRWKKWQRLVQTVPIAVFSRPDQNHLALRGQAKHVIAPWRRPVHQAAGLVTASSPAWVFFPHLHENISATAIRRQGRFTPLDQYKN